MNKVNRYFVVMIILLLGLAGIQAEAKPENREDRTLSPYFYIAGDHPDTDGLPLKSTSAAVDISGVIADVLVTQVYKNEGKKPLEAIYIFPASTRAAVYGMKMTIGKRVIEAKIKKREEARREYEQARAEGRNASLLEQHRPNVFQMNVANIMPGDEIKVELKYTELLVPTHHVYEFVYPAVVGPRYSNAKSSDSADAQRFVENPYLHQGQLSKTTFDMKVAIHAGMPVKNLDCPSHKINPVFESASAAKVLLDKAETYGGNRDFILHYRLDGEKIQTGLLLSQGEKENFFVLMMQPPQRISPADIPGREYIFIVDVSGSMYGFPLSISKKTFGRFDWPSEADGQIQRSALFGWEYAFGRRIAACHIGQHSKSHRHDRSPAWRRGNGTSAGAETRSGAEKRGRPGAQHCYCDGWICFRGGRSV